MKVYEVNAVNFYRDNLQFAYNMNFGGDVTHDVHVGFQWYKDSEDLLRSSNGWGSISVPGGRVAAVNGQLPYYTARFQRLTEGVLPVGEAWTRAIRTGVADANRHGDSHRYANAYTDSYRHRYPDGHGDRYADHGAVSNRHSNADCLANEYTNAGSAHGYSDMDANQHAHIGPANRDLARARMPSEPHRRVS